MTDSVEFRVGEEVNANGITMRVINVSAKGIILRPPHTLTLLVKGVPFKLHKMVKGDLVLRPHQKVEIKKIKKETNHE